MEKHNGTLGYDGLMVVHSLDGMDEISTLAPTQVTEVRDGEIKSYVIDPTHYGFSVGLLQIILAVLLQIMRKLLLLF